MAVPYDEMKHPRSMMGRFGTKPGKNIKKKKRKAIAHLAVPSARSIKAAMTKAPKGS